MILKNYWPRLVSKPKGSKVLILAPHMDDEVIGCGGTIKKHSETGDHVSVLYLTDGSKGMPGKKSSEELKEIRKKEAHRSNKILGVSDYYFLDIPDSSNEDWLDYKIQFIEYLSSINPDLIYLPTFQDMHSDHKKTNYLFAVCVNDTDFHYDVCVYEVWSMVNPNIIINISKQMKYKMLAIQEHKSQLKYIDYNKMIFGLNGYRACFMPIPGIEYSEAFYHTSCNVYVREVKTAYL